MMKMTMKKAACSLVVMMLALSCLPLVVDSFVPTAVGHHEGCHSLFMSTSTTTTSTSEEWKARSLNQPVVTAPAPFYPKPNVQAGALQQVTTPITTPAQQLAQQQIAQQQQATAARTVVPVATATSIRKERAVLGLPTDEWWNRPLDRERDPVPPHQEWKMFYQDGTLPKRIRGGTFMYDNYYSCL